MENFDLAIQDLYVLVESKKSVQWKLEVHLTSPGYSSITSILVTKFCSFFDKNEESLQRNSHTVFVLM
jgi:hypothetical protein